jgi:hypothetical protein
VFEIKDGMFSCSCDPNVKIKADGQEHPVTGSPYADSGIVMMPDNNSVELTGKKGGQVAYHITMMVAADGKTLNRKVEAHTTGDQMVTYSSVYERVGEPRAGANAVAGAWKRQKLVASENGLTFSYMFTGDGLNYKASDGEAYSAKFDGKDYPYTGDPATTTVSLKKIDDNTIEETDKNNGKVMAVTRMSISPDGKSLTMVSQDKREGISNTFVADKQQSQEASK